VTKSTGKRAAQRRREELFSAEMTLARVLLHLKDAYWREPRWQWVIKDALVLVAARYSDVQAQRKLLG
jgi:hypothetical protein